MNQRTRISEDWFRLPTAVAAALGTLLLFGSCGGPDKSKEAARKSADAQSLIADRSYAKALQLINESIKTNTELKQDSALGENELLAGLCYRELGDYSNALQSFQNAVQEFHLIADPKLERKGRIALAEFQYLMNDNAVALSLATDAAGSASVYDDQPDRFRSLRIAANASHRLGQYDGEIAFLEQLIPIDSALHRSANRVDLLRQELWSYAAAGQIDRARGVYARWRSLTTAAGDSSGLLRAVFNWGRVQQSFGHPDSAFRFMSQALGMLNANIPPELHVRVLSAVGDLVYRSGHFDNARRFFGDALPIARQQNDIVMAQALQLMAIACEWKMSGTSSPISQDLIRRAGEVLDTCRDVQFRMGESFARFVEGSIASGIGRLDTAALLYRDAMERYEQTTGIILDENMAAELIDAFMSAEKTGWYDPLLRIACLNGDNDQVFELVERRNLREISRFFTQLSIRTPDKTVNQALSAVRWKYSELRLLEQDMFDELAMGRSRNLERYEALKALYPARLTGLSSAADQFGTVSPNFRWLLRPGKLNLRQIRDTLQTGMAVVEYIPLPDDLCILMTTRDTTIVWRNSVNRQHLIDLIQEYCRLIADPRFTNPAGQFNPGAANGRLNELSAVLGSILIQPLMPALGRVSKLCIVPAPEFGWLPFHTLRVGGTPLVVRTAVSYLPTAAALLFPVKAEHYVSDIIGVGHPGRTTWDVEYELKDIRGFYDKARMLFGTNATLSKLDTAAYDVLHFAAEFVVNTKVPDRSAIILSDGDSPDGTRAVPLGEMLSLRPPETLVFSNITPTPGMFWRYAPLGFLADGTPAVIATMWQGERKAKKYFGEIFYTSLQAGSSGAQAYQNAMAALAKHPDFSALYRWGLYYQFGR